MRLRLQHFVLLLLICGLLLSAPLVLAQDDDGDTEPETSTETTDAAEQDPGLPTVVLIGGFLAIVAVGGIMTMREGFKQPDSGSS